MAKHISQKGAFHYTYIAGVKNDRRGVQCSYYNNGICSIDKKPCIDNNYCKKYTTDYVPRDNTKTITITIYTLKLHENNSVDTIKVYSSHKDVLSDAYRISPNTTLAYHLKNKHKNDTFQIGDTRYLVLDIEYKTIHINNK